MGKLRKWTDEPEPMGLPEPIQDLLILAYAEQTNRVFKYHLGPAIAEIGSLDDDMTLEEVALPDEQDWTDRAGPSQGLVWHSHVAAAQCGQRHGSGRSRA